MSFHVYFYFVHGLCCFLYVLYFTIDLVLLHVLFCFIFCEPAIFQASKLPTGDGGMRGAIKPDLAGERKAHQVKSVITSR